MRIDLELEVPIERTVKVKQLEGMFDIPEAKRATLSLHVLVPVEQRNWSVGLIVGPSGAGKTQSARALFGDEIIAGYDWHPKRCLLDSFEVPIRDAITALSSVGFSSAPGWLKPFRVLSNGEQFRATMARALCDTRQRIVIDEFTSVVDRQVARIGANAIGKAIRRSGRQLVAVSCHDDIIDWLQPDWILEPHASRFAWRSVQRRPPIHLDIRRVSTSAWSTFSPHHYLTGGLNRSAWCWGAWLDEKLVAFDAWLPFVGKLSNGRKGRRDHRTVVLPDYQGVGIGTAVVELIASMWSGLGLEALSRTAHPGEIKRRITSPNWQVQRYGFASADGGNRGLSRTRTRTRRALSSRWIGPAMPRAQAELLLG